MTNEQAERLIAAVEHGAEALMVLAGQVDLSKNDGTPGPLEAIAMLLGANGKPTGWPDHGELLERLVVAVEKLEAER